MSIPVSPRLSCRMRTLRSFTCRRLLRMILFLLLLAFVISIFTVRLRAPWAWLSVQSQVGAWLFDNGLVPCGLRKEPLVQFVAESQIRILWETNCNFKNPRLTWTSYRDGAANYDGDAHNVEATLTQKALDRYHFIYYGLINVADDTTYQYTICLDHFLKRNYVFGNPGTTKTPLNIIIVGDSHHFQSIYSSLLRLAAEKSPDYLIHAGDMVSNSNSIGWQTNFFDPVNYANLSQTRPFLIAQGNHDWRHHVNNGYAPQPTWFATTLGKTRFLVLDTNDKSPAQLNWLQAELASSVAQSANFRVVIQHIPPFIEFWDPSAWNAGESRWNEYVRLNYVPLFNENHVDLVISGHQHNYQRGSRDGIMYIVCGGAGGRLDVEQVEQHHMYEATFLHHHYMSLKIEEEALEINVFSTNDKIIDSAIVKKKE